MSNKQHQLHIILDLTIYTHRHSLQMIQGQQRAAVQFSKIRSQQHKRDSSLRSAITDHHIVKILKSPGWMRVSWVTFKELSNLVAIVA